MPLGSWPLSSSYVVFSFCKKSLTSLEGAGVGVMTQVPGFAAFHVWRSRVLIDPCISQYFCNNYTMCSLYCADSFLFYVSYPLSLPVQTLSLNTVLLRLYLICSMLESNRVSSSGSTFALYVICSLPESKRVSSSGSTLHYTYFVSLMGVGS